MRGREGPTAERGSGAPWVRLRKRNLSARRDEFRAGAQVSGATSLLPSLYKPSAWRHNRGIERSQQLPNARCCALLYLIYLGPYPCKSGTY